VGYLLFNVDFKAAKLRETLLFAEKERKSDTSDRRWQFHILRCSKYNSWSIRAVWDSSSY